MAAREDGAVPWSRRAGIWSAALFGAGLLFARTVDAGAPWWWFGAAGAMGLLALFRPARWGGWALCGALLALGTGWWIARVERAPAGWLGRALDGGREAIVEVEGVAASRPRAHEPELGQLGRFARRQPGEWFWLRVYRARDEHGAWRAASGDLWVRLPAAGDGAAAEGLGVRMGDLVRATGRAGVDDRPFNPGAPGAEWARQARRAGFLSVPDASLLGAADAREAPLSARARGAWLGLVGGAQLRALAWREGASHSRGRALMASLLVGEREPGLDEVRGWFTEAGMAHILAISGMHLTILAWTATLGLRLFADPGRWEAPIVLGAVLVYVLIVPAGAPVVRAAIMTCGFIVAQSLGRRYDRLNILGWTALAALVWRPLELWSPGFQLSFACVGALIWLAPALRGRWFGEPHDPDEHGALGWAAGRAKDALCAAVAAWVASAPIVAFHFGAVPLLGVPASLIGLPFATLALGVGFLAVLVGAVIPGAGAIAGMVIAPIGAGLAHVAGWIDAAPLTTLRTPPMSVAGAVGLAVVGAWWLRWGLPAGAGGRVRAFAAGALAVGLIAWDGARVGLPEWEAARVDTLAVGDGTCHLVRSGRDAALWDCGGSAPGLGVRLIPGAVRALGAWKVRTVVISHPNLDHFFGLLDVIEPLGVRRVVVGEAFASAAAARPSGPEATALASLLRLGVRVDLAGAGDVLALGGARLEFLGPLRGQVFDDANDASLVARLSVATSAGEMRFLLTGDIERPGMRALLARGVDVGADVLEAPHHGSAAGGAPEFFIEAARPSVVVQSTGSGRVGDERWDGAKRGRVWWTTAADGAVWTSFGRDGEVRTGAHAAGAGPDRRRAGRGRTQGPVQLEAGRTPVPENDTVGRESPVSNRSSAIAPGAR